MIVRNIEIPIGTEIITQDIDNASYIFVIISYILYINKDRVLNLGLFIYIFNNI